MAETAEPKRPCECGHSRFDHLGGVGRCDEGTRRCRCSTYRECTHRSTEDWRGLTQCTVCRNILERIG